MTRKRSMHNQYYHERTQLFPSWPLKQDGQQDVQKRSKCFRLKGNRCSLHSTETINFPSCTGCGICVICELKLWTMTSEKEVFVQWMFPTLVSLKKTVLLLTVKLSRSSAALMQGEEHSTKLLKTFVQMKLWMGTYSFYFCSNYTAGLAWAPCSI